MCLKEVDIVKRTYSEALAIDASKKQVGNFYEKFPSIEAVLDEKSVAFLSMCAAKKRLLLRKDDQQLANLHSAILVKLLPGNRRKAIARKNRLKVL